MISCNKYTTHRLVLFHQLDSIVPGITSLAPLSLTDILLYGSKDFDFGINHSILTSVIDYIKDTKRFAKLEAFTVS